MKLLCLLMLAAVAIQSCGKSTIFSIKNIVADRSEHAPYVILKIASNDEIQIVAIQNSDLYFRFKEMLGLSASNYESELVRHIQNDIPFAVSDISSNELRTYFVALNAQIDTNKAIGKEQFVAYYFDNKIQKLRLTYDEEKYLIKTLFDWNIFVRRDDESGALIICN